MDLKTWRRWFFGGVLLLSGGGCNSILGLDKDYQQLDCPFEDSCPDAASQPDRRGSGRDASAGGDQAAPPSADGGPKADAGSRSDADASLSNPDGESSDSSSEGGGCVPLPRFCENRCG